MVISNLLELRILNDEANILRGQSEEIVLVLRQQGSIQLNYFIRT